MNGTCVEIGTLNGKAYFLQAGGYDIRWDGGGNWRIFKSPTSYYYATGNTTYPWDPSLTWTVLSGSSPAPSVTQEASANLSHLNGQAASGISHMNGIALSGVSHINGIAK